MKKRSLKKILFLSGVLLCCSYANSQKYVSIPDVNFEQTLIDLKLDDQLDGKVLKSNVSDLEQLDVSGKSIERLKGIENFVSLTYLNCSNNKIHCLNIKNNKALKELNCENNRLKRLNITKNKNLESLNCSYNQLTNVDLSSNLYLSEFIGSDNDFEELDLSFMTFDNMGGQYVRTLNNPHLSHIKIGDLSKLEYVYNDWNPEVLEIDYDVVFNVDKYTFIKDGNGESDVVLIRKVTAEAFDLYHLNEESETQLVDIN